MAATATATQPAATAGILWFRALRAPFLVATLLPVGVGVLSAWQLRGAFDTSLFALTLLGAVCIHLATNMFNDHWDFRSGNDLAVKHQNPFAGGGRVLIQGVLNPRVHFAVAATFAAVGALIGLALVLRVGWPLLLIGLVGGIAAVFYVAPPLRLAHAGVGEVFVGLSFGPLVVNGAYFVQTGAFDIGALLLSVAMGLLVGAILWINEFPDIEADAAVGKRTMVVRLGPERATSVYVGLLAGAYAAVAMGIVLGFLAPRGTTPLALLAFLTLPLAARTVRGLRQHGRDPMALIPFNAATILLTMVFGVLLLVALAVDALLL